MATGHLSIEEFFTGLSELFDSRRKSEHGSIFLTQKRLSHGSSGLSSPSSPTDLPSESFADLHPASPLPVLIRATDGKLQEYNRDKIKLSTIVQPDDLEGFFVRYAEVCRTGMQALKKRDRSGRKKAKAKKRKGGVEGEKKA
ncbi:signal recognition particle 14kd protein [Lasallia pustulata]|uniref:Signal recognition particle subunit SRP14 n=1 Tax=Lasallia pustulata TaxID=136370 RepID=A0A1W5DDZ7_9LECA|nr:signal recognition particle 14kd protein [Lasallia pustulata]